MSPGRWHPVLLLAALGVIGCSLKPRKDSAYSAKAVYAEMREASVRGDTLEKAFPDGRVFARNHASAGDSDGCNTTLVFTAKAATVGSTIGFTRWIPYSEPRWEDRLLIALWNHSCADKSFMAVATDGFDFLRLRGFVRKMQASGFYGLFLADLPETDSGSVPLRPITLARIAKNPGEFLNLGIPTEKRIQRILSDVKRLDNELSPQDSRARSAVRSKAEILDSLKVIHHKISAMATRLRTRQVRFIGKVAVQITIHPLGHVVDVKVVEDTIQYPVMTSGIVEIIKSTKFRRVHASHNEIITVPYTFGD